MTGRKPTTSKRRPRHEPLDDDWFVVDDDLRQLADVITQATLENSANGWFELPWHDGWNAATLAYDAWAIAARARSATVPRAIGALAAGTAELLLRRSASVSAYADADELLDVAAELVIMMGRDDVRFLSAALRCAQVHISNSSGGGTVYNGVLARPFERAGFPERFADVIMRNRCRDAIGTDIVMEQDGHDKLRRAFKTAWERGLYRAAYALPRVP